MSRVCRRRVVSGDARRLLAGEPSANTGDRAKVEHLGEIQPGQRIE